MKIRNGFVSNSSSSSFIIAFKKEKNICPHCGRSDPNIKELIGNSQDGENSWDYEGYDNVLKEAKDWWDDIEEKMKPYKDKGYEFAYISVSYHDETLNTLLETSKDIVIIDKSG